MRIRPRTYYRRTPDRTLLRDTGRRDPGGIYDGTVGWEDGDDHFDIDPDGVTLVKVTLHKGRMPDTDDAPTNDRAKGTRILARISAPLYNIPPDGSEVHVSMPAGRLLDPGAGAIIAQLSASPAGQFNGSKSKLDFGPDFDLVIKARSITLTDYEDRYLTLGPTYGFKIGDANANGCQLKNDQWLFYTSDGTAATTTFRLSKSDGIALMINDGQTCGMTMQSGEWVGVGSVFKAMFAGGYLGSAPTALTPLALFGPGIASIVSTSWFGSVA